MAKNKSLLKKKRLGKKTTQAKRLPVFVTVRTKRKVVWNNKTRNWRSSKMKASEKGD